MRKEPCLLFIVFIVFFFIKKKLAIKPKEYQQCSLNQDFLLVLLFGNILAIPFLSLFTSFNQFFFLLFLFSYSVKLQIYFTFFCSSISNMHAEVSSLCNQTSKLKIVLLGESGAGKTSLVQQIVNGSFDKNCKPTVYLDSVKKTVSKNGRIFKLVFWDTAGQERFNCLVPSAIKGSHCALIVFDLSDRQSFERCNHWLNLLKESNDSDCPAILIGNKTDLVRKIEKIQGYSFAKQRKMRYIQTCALNGEGIKNIIPEIIDLVESKEQTSTKQSDNQIINTERKLVELDQVKLNKLSKSCCSV